MARIEVAGCLIIREGKILLLWKKSRQHYELPGGRIDPGETPEQTAVREAHEELGCAVELTQTIPAVTVRVGDDEIVSHRFLAEIVHGTPHVAEPAVFDHLIWMPILDYAKFAVASNVVEFCKLHVLDGRNQHNRCN